MSLNLNFTLELTVLSRDTHVANPPKIDKFRLSDLTLAAMADPTLGQLDARLTQIDELLLEDEFGNPSLEPSERFALEAEANAILKVLAEELGKAQNRDPQEMYELRNKIRTLRHLSARVAQHVKLHPDDPEADRIVTEAFQGLNDGTKTHEEASHMINSIFDPSRFGTCKPKETRFAGWFKRIFNRTRR